MLLADMRDYIQTQERVDDDVSGRRSLGPRWPFSTWPAPASSPPTAPSKNMHPRSGTWNLATATEWLDTKRLHPRRQHKVRRRVRKAVGARALSTTPSQESSPPESGGAVREHRGGFRQRNDNPQQASRFKQSCVVEVSSKSWPGSPPVQYQVRCPAPSRP